MEDKEFVLFDYLCMLWSRKILIIVVTLACVVTGVIWSALLPTRYRAEVHVRIGQGITITPTLSLLDEPVNMLTTIPVKYASMVDTGYALSVDVIHKTPLMKVIVVGPNAGKAKEYLKNIVGLIVGDHRRITEELVESYRILAEGIGDYIEAVGEELVQFSVSEKKISGTRVDDSFLMSEGLKARGTSLISLQRESEYKLYANSLRTNMTKVVGEIGAGKIGTNKTKIVMIAGVLGLTISVLLSSLIEYINKYKNINNSI